MPLVSPLLKIRCPYCRRQFHPGDCAIYSTANQRVLRPAPLPGSREYFLSRTWIEELSGPLYVEELARRQCPFCFKELFDGIETCDNLNIAIVGDTSSGKTHYIASLIDQLNKGALIWGGNGISTLTPLNKYTSETYLARYYRPIFVDRSSARGTPQGTFDVTGMPIKTEPLVYQLSLQGGSPSDGNFTINLLFYDISGEDMADVNTLVRFGEHILRADGIIYLADPLSMPRLRRQFPPEIQSLTISQRTSQAVLGTVLFRLGPYNRVRPNQQVAVPMAITLSKSDLLQHVISPQDRRQFRIMQRTVYDGKAHQAEIGQVDLEVRGCLHAYGETLLLNMSQRFQEVSFFAISATGSAPDSNGKYSSIEPHRCLDPLVWLLWKLDYIEGVR